MLIRLKKMQLICGVCLLFQVILASWFIPFHLLACLLSLLLIGWQRRFRVIYVRYHYYVCGLYVYRIWIITCPVLYLFELLYLICIVYVAIIIIACGCRAIF